MINCSGCGKEIYEIALNCPHCGAPQQSVDEKGADGFFELGLQPLKKYAVFQGRAGRKEYWYFFSLYLIAMIFVTFLQDIMGNSTFSTTLLSLALCLPNWSVAVRRMHDSNRSGWWVLVPIVAVVFLFFKGDQSENRFGQPQKTLNQ